MRNLFWNSRIKHIGLRFLGIVLSSAVFLSACGNSASPENNAREEAMKRGTEIVKTMGLDDGELTVMPKDLYTEPGRDCTEIKLSDGGSSAKRGVRTEGNTVRIIASGTYLISGSLSNGQLIIDLPKTEDARLILDGVSLHCDGSAPLLIEQADKVVLSLAPGSSNRISGDGSGKGKDGRKEDAVIMSSEDLVLNGSGTLALVSGEGSGIHTRDSLKIMEGNLRIRSGRSGIIGRDAVVIGDGSISIEAGEDGITATNSEDPGRGYIFIGGGNLEITAKRYDIRAFDAFIYTYGQLGLSGGENGIDCARKVLLGEGIYRKNTEVAEADPSVKEDQPETAGRDKEQEAMPPEQESRGNGDREEPSEPAPPEETEETRTEPKDSGSDPEKSGSDAEDQGTEPEEDTREETEPPEESSAPDGLINGYPEDSFKGFSGGLRERRGK